MAEFKAPPVEVGMDVYWYPGGGRNTAPFPAKVVKVGATGISVVCFADGTSGLYARDGVRHVDDASIRKLDLQEYGAWDHVPWMRPYVEELAARLKAEAEEAKKKASEAKKKAEYDASKQALKTAELVTV